MVNRNRLRINIKLLEFKPANILSKTSKSEESFMVNIFYKRHQKKLTQSLKRLRTSEGRWNNQNQMMKSGTEKGKLSSF